MSSVRTSASLALVALVAVLGAALPAADTPTELDRCGIDWSRPFSKAQARAETEQRLLLIKPIAFGTNAKGCW